MEPQQPRRPVDLTDPGSGTETAEYLLLPHARAARPIRRLLEQLHWAGFLMVPRPAEQLAERYFDTEDQALREQGFTLREERHGEHALLMLERAGAPTDRILQAVESPDARIPPAFGPVQQRLIELLPADATLAPCLELERTRRRYTLRQPEQPRAQLELRLERVHIPAADARYRTVQVLLKHGPRELLEQARQVLASRPQFAPGRMPAAERALLFATGSPPLPAASAEHLTARSRWLDLADVHLRAQFQLLQHHAPCAWEGLHPEGVHQMRVATRRLREALRIFGAALPPAEVKRLQTDLAWLGRKLGAVRDCDVQAGRLGRYARHLEKHGLVLPASYKEELGARHAEAAAKLRKALDAARFRRLARDHEALRSALLGASDAAPRATIAAAAAPDIARQLRKLFERGRRFSADTPSRRLHKFRIRAKHARYLLEFVDPACGERFSPCIAALTRIQDTLGDHQDAEVATADLQRHLAEPVLPAAERKALQRLLAFEARKARKARARFDAEWPDFAATVVPLFQDCTAAALLENPPSTRSE